MKDPKKVLISTIAVIALSAASVSMVSAYGGFDGPRGSCDRGSYSDGPRDKGSKGKDINMEQRVTDKLDWIKYKLRITEKQEPAWKELTDTIDKSVASMKDARQQRNTDQPVPEKVKQMRDRAKQMTEVANAIEKMYNALTPEQKKIADELNPRRIRRF